MRYQILPSILSADWLRLGEEINAVMQAGANTIHFDVMDNHFVPNLTFGPLICQRLHESFPNLAIDVHLMATPVERLIEDFATAGAKRISIHPEATWHLDKNLQRIQALGIQAGIALNPATSPECIAWCQHHLNFVLVMTVNPGFGGQHLLPAVIKKIEWIKTNHPQITICVDGGIHVQNIKRIADAGATEFVMGSALFHSNDYAQMMQTLQAALTEPKR